MPKIDILKLDAKIREQFRKEAEIIPEYDKRLLDIRKTLEIDSLSERLRKNLKQTEKEIVQKIKDLKNGIDLQYYISESIPLIQKYREILNTPMVISFTGKTNKNSKEKRDVLDAFLRVAKKYSKEPIEIKNRESRIVCNNCDNKEYFDVEENNIFICRDCGSQQEKKVNTTSYKDSDRINISSKYRYDKRIHFRDSVNQYQGKQNSTIEDKVYEGLTDQFEKHHLLLGKKGDPKEIRFSKITKLHVHLFLKELKFTKHYENVNLIHYNLTGKKPDDISHLEDKLMNDFDILSEAYHELYRNKPGFDRKNFINTQYVLYQLLRKYKHPCKKSDFTILKTSDRKSFHDEVAKNCFQHVGWTFTSGF